MEASGQNAGRVMISYCHEDKRMVSKITKALRAKDISVWIDRDDMKDDIIESMEEGVDGSEVIILCVSENYNRSENCKKEYTYAGVQNKQIIPVKLGETMEYGPGLGIIIKSKLYYDFSDDNAFEINISTLIDRVQCKLGKPSRAADIPPGTSDSPDGDIGSSGRLSIEGGSKHNVGNFTEKLAERIIGSEFNKLKNVCQEKMPKGMVEYFNAADFFNKMIELRLINPKNGKFYYLEKCLKQIGRTDLADNLEALWKES